VVDHEEHDGHTWYNLRCALAGPGRDAGTGEESGDVFNWDAQRRLTQLRASLHDAVADTISPQVYRKHFTSAPFARFGGVPGTTSRLNSWCRALAQAISLAEVPPLAVATTLHALGAPVKESALKAFRRRHLSDESAFVSGATSAPEFGPDNKGTCELTPELSIDVAEEDQFSSSEEEDVEDMVGLNPDGEPESYGGTRDVAASAAASATAMESATRAYRGEAVVANALGAGCNEADSIIGLDVSKGPEALGHAAEFGSNLSEGSDVLEKNSEPDTEQEMPPPFFMPFESFPHGAPTSPGAQPFWSHGDAAKFEVRFTGYRKGKDKRASQFALYETVGVDAVRSGAIISKVVDKLDVLPASPTGAPEWSPSWAVPRVLIMNAQVPTKSGGVLGRSSKDPGMSLVSYHVLSAPAAELLARGEATPAIGLWRRFVEAGVSTADGTCLKAIGCIDNLADLSMPSMVKQFNAKPVLVTKSATHVRHRLPEVLEIDFDIRQWSYPARQALVGQRALMKQAVAHCGYLIEGKSDTELPEQILACFRMHYVDMDLAKDVPKL